MNPWLERITEALLLAGMVWVCLHGITRTRTRKSRPRRYACLLCPYGCDQFSDMTRHAWDVHKVPMYE